MLHSSALGAAAPLVLAGIVLGSVFTTIYSLRFLWGAFADKGAREPSVRVAEMHRPPVTFLLPPAVLAAAGLLFGLWPAGLDSVLDDYAETIDGESHYYLRSGTGSGCRWCCRCSSWRSAPRCSSVAGGCRAAGRDSPRWATPTASTTR